MFDPKANASPCIISLITSNTCTSLIKVNEYGKLHFIKLIFSC